MRILRLTPNLQKKLLKSRHAPDAAALRIAGRIVKDVRRRGDAALFAWTKKLDGLDLRNSGAWISPRQIVAARKSASPEFLRAVSHAARNVRRIARQQLPRPWTVEAEPGVKIRQMVRPIESVGCYVPGGRFALISTMIMTVVPAQIAGVKEIVVACPKPNTEMLAAAAILGLTRVAQIGGAQAIAALACGTKSIPRVEKIIGPGNRFVTAAKQIVSYDCAIDLPAGPTEAIVLAEQGNARWIAADLIAQAEHAPDAAGFLLTTSAALAREVQAQIAVQLSQLPSENPAHLSLKNSGAIFAASSLAQACEFVNEFAPEHLSLPGRATNTRALLNQIRAAGTIFLGSWAAQPMGDYASGSNHVLPTAGWARRRGGLSAADFVKCITVQEISGAGFATLAPDVQTLARAEGLLGHSNAIEVRR
ncbi:MAG TPA: histidinol dehydrogenase [Candidatus Acidoferrales bacterium]|nr:histidinol dehydrogenase [Candidatus Acidoferrales bacterium]